MFTARSRQGNAFERRRQAQAEAAAAAAPAPAPEASPEPPAPKPVQMAAAYNGSQSPDHIETPDIATYATGGIVERAAHPGPRGNEHMYSPADERAQLGQGIKSAPIEIPAETQAKIDAVMNHAISPAVEPEPTSESETTAILADVDTMAAIAEGEAELAAEAPEPKRGRGRPRPVETIIRDGKVYDLLKAADPDEGVSKEALAIALGEKEQQVYSSLRQLTKEGRAESRYVKPHGYRWFAVSPAETA